ncbi:MAG: hypothetical protein V3T05_05000, partial [Myxococcota bacterium]
MRRIDLVHHRVASMLLPFALTVTACGASDPARVHISIADLVQHAAQNAVTFDRVVLRVHADDIDPTIEVTIDPKQLSFDLDVPAGRERNFEVEALNGEVPEYWGLEIIDRLEPRSETDIEITVYPAGAVQATVSLCGGGALPEGAVVTFTADAPRAGLPATLEAEVVGDTVRRTLPRGGYTVSGSFEADGATYNLAAAQVEVRPGEVSSGLELLFSGPDADAQVAAGLLAARNLRQAREAYRCAAATNPSDRKAQFGAAFTRMLLLPEHAAVDDLLSACGEAPLDVESLLFGAGTGLVSYFESHRGGDSRLQIDDISSGAGSAS